MNYNSPNNVVWVFCFVCIIFTGVNAVSINLDDTECGLRCWLQNLTIIIPPQSMVKDGFNFTVTEMRCSGIDLGRIESSFTPPVTVMIDVNGFGTTCSADWSIYEQSWPHLSASGGVQAVVANSEIGVELSLQKGNDGLAVAAQLDTCSVNIVVKSINFSGGVLDRFLQWFSGMIASAVQKELKSITCDELGVMVNNNLTDVILEIDQSILPYMGPQPPPMPPPVPAGIVYLPDNPLANLVGYAVRTIFAPGGVLSLNNLFERLLHGPYLHLNKEELAVLNYTVTIAGAGDVTIGLLDVNVGGLDTWGAIDLWASGNQSLSLHSLLNELDINVTFYVNVTGDDSLIDDTYLYEEGILTTRLSQNNMNLTVQVALIQEAIQSLKASQFADLGCLIATVYNLNLTQLYFNMTVEKINIIAIDGGLEQDVDTMIDNVLDLFVTTYRGAIPAFWNAYISEPVRVELNSVITEFLTNDDYICSPPITDPPTFNKHGTIAAFSGVGFLILLSLAYLLYSHFSINKQKDLEPLIPKLPVEPCLAVHPRIPSILRYGIPVLLLLNLGLFISSNTSVGATVYMVLAVSDIEIKTPGLFTFSLANSIRDMWHAGVYPLSIIIAVFSGSWPYIKLLAMLSCWFTPSTILSTKKRERVLMTLDVLGKWSLVDAFVLTLMVVAFRFHLAQAIPDTNPPEVATADVLVGIEYGFMTFLYATMLSLVLTHSVLACHRRAVTVETKEEVLISAEETEERLCNQAFPHPVMGPIGRALIAISILIAIGLICYGVVIDSFAFEFRGAAGYVFELLGESSKTRYSVIGLGLTLPESSENPDGFGIKFIQATYFAFCITVPIADLVVLFYLWLARLTPKMQRRIFVIAEILNAWCALEVFILSLIAALLEIRQFAAFIIGDKCDMINEILAKYFSDKLDGDNVCFDVKASLEKGCWVLFAACIMSMFVSTLVTQMCHRALAKHQQRHMRHSIN